ncbi:MAG: desulfoferrodoxin [Desulfobulbaceae bacterium]|nr:MAG: desulfoferrodoxin [Desulfobulbaceae bacterium]
MAGQLDIFKCEKCGNVVELLHAGGGALFCCNAPMDYMAENTVDAAKEKHVPVVEKKADGYLVKVGSTPHPMTEEHLIMWIELIADGVVHRRFLAPGDAPEAMFDVKADQVTAREYCNLHGLWRS